MTTEPVRPSPAQAAGRLYVVATPIGNLEDITLRALRVLKEADLIACEDTRRTQKLLEHYEIRARTVSYHEHNEMTRAPELIVAMEQGASVALVSDAGMPVISDPGHRLVRLALRHGLPVIPVPGPSAFVAALAVSGLPLDRFHFVGFLPPKRLPRRRVLARLKEDDRTLVFYEAPHRLLEMMEDVQKLLGERPVVVAREVTKMHEEFVRGSASEVLARLQRRPVKGEITVLVGADSMAGERPAVRRAASDSISRAITDLMKRQGLDERAALKAVARARGLSKSEAYRQWQSEKS